MPRNYGTAEPVYVPLTIGTSSLKYGFPCRLQRDSEYTTLGITAITAAAINDTLIQGMIWGANSPKPPRASKIFDTNPPGSESSFCSNATATLAAARADGWRIRPAKISRKGTQTPRSVTAYVTINGVKYAWQMPRTQTGVLDVTTLSGTIGVRIADASDDDLVFGASFPKPPRAKRNVSDPEDPADDTFSSFYDPSSTLPAEWVAVNAPKTNLTTAADFATLI